jgi:hypothetical protein
MTTQTAYNHLTRLKSRMDSIYSAARSYCSTHADILQRLKAEVWEDAALKKCPAWVRSSLSNHSGAKLEEIHRHFVLWAFMCPDGKPRVWEQLDDSTRLSYCQSGEDKKTGNHFWLRLTNSHSQYGAVNEQTFTQVWEITSNPFS